ncbi:MAG TPA: 2-succinyl-5-enolpyruvyl-6-hydroxy-3-cyclohexene-1-carboxylic-acid synthase [Polyangiaceae bacterium]|nr:2-succinyl-5-enolpyruvyl-6-hydroxy-3-cyclohexene-1-carboxylic-acid synthase [Polyangiaceae bacterium]
MTGAIVGEWARLLFGCLAQAGVRDCIVSPGSRSTPFAWAAAGTPGLRCHSLLDERSAAFFALGLARVTGEPALLLCTSGSAAANYCPAVVEASLARVPLLVMTADRPLELQDAGAPQTIDQVKLYGEHVRRFFDLGVPEASPSSLGGLMRLVTQGFAAALAPEPGPVHLNARARKPLEPGAAETEADRAVAAAVSALLGRGVTRVATAEPAPSAEGIRRLTAAVAGARRGLIVCGPLPVHAERAREAIVELSERLALPLFAEATSGIRFGASGKAAADALELLLRSPECRKALAPDCIVRFGGTPTSGAFEALLDDHPSAALHVVAEHGHPDPLGRARSLTVGPSDAIAATVLASVVPHEPHAEQRAFAERVQRANSAAWETVRHVLESEPPGSEPATVRTAVESVPPGGLVVVGNSLPVRLLDAFVPAGARRLAVASQRGANGIDGLVAGAAGSALAAGKPTLLLLGDVSLAHDLGGLAAARLVKSPLVVLVIDNEGGRIFDHLPVANLYGAEPERAELWLTPPRLAFEHAGPLFGIPYAAPATLGELRAALGRAFSHPGPTLVHARVTPDSARGALAKLKAALDQTAAPLLAAAGTVSR